MDTLGYTLAMKAIETLSDSQASKCKGRYYRRHTRNKEGKWSARCTRLETNTGIARPYKLVAKNVETLGNASLR